jgi:diguanylate cyclase (GGDEF)-like protein
LGAVNSFLAFARAFWNPYTYNVRRNTYLWLGMFWGLLVPCFVYALDVSRLGPGPKGFLEAFRVNPAHVVFFIQPIILGVLFGAAGTIRQELEVDNQRLLQAMEQLAMTDSLTGLHNRRFLEEALKNLKEIARRTSTSLFVIFLDLDGFKAINDGRGHLAGDRVLCDVASALKSALRQSDLLGRHGGDEFVLAGLGGRESASVLAMRASEAVRSKAGLTFSHGIGCWPDDGEGIEDLVALADRSLGKAKKKSQDSRILPRIKEGA